jgi:hypothetical protein
MQSRFSASANNLHTKMDKSGIFPFPYSNLTSATAPHPLSQAGKIGPLVAEVASGLSLILFHEQYIYIYVVTCIAWQRLGKHIPEEANAPPSGQFTRTDK